MTIAFRQLTLFNDGGAPPHTTGSFTPNAGGDAIVLICLTADGPNENIQVSSSAGGTYNSLIQYNSAASATWSQNGTVACVAGAQTFTITESNVGFVETVTGVDYSGVASISNSSIIEQSAPGLGAGAIVGTSVVVPVGSVLVAICIEPINSETITDASGGTSRGFNQFNPSFRTSDYAGAGSAIQPLFTTSANGSAVYYVFQFILNPPQNTASIAWTG